MMEGKAFAVLFAVLVVLQGCDFLRSLAGRPTSAELRALRADAEADSLRAAASDSLLEALSASTAPEAAYFVVAGCFRVPANAEVYAERYRSWGYETCIVDRGGFQVVGLCPTGDISEAYRKLYELKALGVCPQDSWVMENI